MSILDQENKVIQTADEAVDEWHKENDCLFTACEDNGPADYWETYSIAHQVIDDYELLEDKPSYKNKRMEASFDANSRQSWKYRNRR